MSPGVVEIEMQPEVHLKLGKELQVLTLHFYLWALLLQLGNLRRVLLFTTSLLRSEEPSNSAGKMNSEKSQKDPSKEVQNNPFPFVSPN